MLAGTSESQSSVVNSNPISGSSELNYAGFSKRLLAGILDGFILGIGAFVISFVVSFVTAINSSGLATSTPSRFSTLTNLVVLILEFSYYIYFIGAKGQTPGKMALGIKVVKVGTSEAPGYLKAFLREVVGKLLSVIILFLGYLWMLWDSKKQTWHDKIAGTIVIKV